MEKLQIIEITAEMPLKDQIENHKENLLNIKRTLNAKEVINGSIAEVHPDHKRKFYELRGEQLRNLVLLAKKLENKDEEKSVYNWIIDNL